MKLIIILASLGLERYMNLGAMLHRFEWFGLYAKSLRSVVKPDALWRSWQGLALLLLPILLVLWLVYWLVADATYGIVGMLFGFAILFYCLGPNDLYQKIQDYLMGDQSEKEKGDALETLLGATPPATDTEASRAVTSAIFVQSNESIFAVVFWFVILGPVGAVLYRLSAVINQTSNEKGSDLSDMSSEATFLQNVLDWAPSRILALMFAAAGNFGSTFKHFLKNIYKGLDSSRNLISDCGILALGLKIGSSTGANEKENQNAVDLLDRALIFVLVLIALFTLGAWIS